MRTFDVHVYVICTLGVGAQNSSSVVEIDNDDT